ncbi:MAG: hypothetical protein ACI3Y5_08260 [Prevotella sp.]
MTRQTDVLYLKKQGLSQCFVTGAEWPCHPALMSRSFSTNERLIQYLSQTMPEKHPPRGVICQLIRHTSPHSPLALTALMPLASAHITHECLACSRVWHHVRHREPQKYDKDREKDDFLHTMPFFLLYIKKNTHYFFVRYLFFTNFAA